MGEFPVYETTIDGRRLAFFHPGAGAPVAVNTLEFAIQLGCKKFIAIGSAGAVQQNLPPHQLVIPVAAIRDEGTSYHYLPPGPEVVVNR
jgi:uridine phosphorylase